MTLGGITGLVVGWDPLLRLMTLGGITGLGGWTGSTRLMPPTVITARTAR